MGLVKGGQPQLAAMQPRPQAAPATAAAQYGKAFGNPADDDVPVGFVGASSRQHMPAAVAQPMADEQLSRQRQALQTYQQQQQAQAAGRAWNEGVGPPHHQHPGAAVDALPAWFQTQDSQAQAAARTAAGVSHQGRMRPHVRDQRPKSGAGTRASGSGSMPASHRASRSKPSATLVPVRAKQPEGMALVTECSAPLGAAHQAQELAKAQLQALSERLDSPAQQPQPPAQPVSNQLTALQRKLAAAAAQLKAASSVGQSTEGERQQAQHVVREEKTQPSVQQQQPSPASVTAAAAAPIAAPAPAAPAAPVPAAVSMLPTAATGALLVELPQHRADNSMMPGQPASRSASVSTQAVRGAVHVAAHVPESPVGQLAPAAAPQQLLPERGSKQGYRLLAALSGSSTSNSQDHSESSAPTSVGTSHPSLQQSSEGQLLEGHTLPLAMAEQGRDSNEELRATSGHDAADNGSRSVGAAEDTMVQQEHESSGQHREKSGGYAMAHIGSRPASAGQPVEGATVLQGAQTPQQLVGGVAEGSQQQVAAMPPSATSSHASAAPVPALRHQGPAVQLLPPLHELPAHESTDAHHSSSAVEQEQQDEELLGKAAGHETDQQHQPRRSSSPPPLGYASTPIRVAQEVQRAQMQHAAQLRLQAQRYLQREARAAARVAMPAGFAVPAELGIPSPTTAPAATSPAPTAATDGAATAGAALAVPPNAAGCFAVPTMLAIPPSPSPAASASTTPPAATAGAALAVPAGAAGRLALPEEFGMGIPLAVMPPAAPSPAAGQGDAGGAGSMLVTPASERGPMPVAPSSAAQPPAPVLPAPPAAPQPVTAAAQFGRAGAQAAAKAASSHLTIGQKLAMLVPELCPSVTLPPAGPEEAAAAAAAAEAARTTLGISIAPRAALQHGGHAADIPESHGHSRHGVAATTSAARASRADSRRHDTPFGFALGLPSSSNAKLPGPATVTRAALTGRHMRATPAGFVLGVPDSSSNLLPQPARPIQTARQPHSDHFGFALGLPGSSGTVPGVTTAPVPAAVPAAAANGTRRVHQVGFELGLPGLGTGQASGDSIHGARANAAGTSTPHMRSTGKCHQARIQQCCGSESAMARISFSNCMQGTTGLRLSRVLHALFPNSACHPQVWPHNFHCCCTCRRRRSSSY